MILAGLALGFVPHLRSFAQRGAEQFVDRTGYADAVLKHKPNPAGQTSADESPWKGWVSGLISTAGAVVLALLALSIDRFPAPVRRKTELALGRPLGWLRTLHSGDVGDYTAWLILGAAAMAVVWTLTIR